ncbi:HD domain-containing protein [Aureisphaera galaxeae]|uniref:HD domain-containing protein n=1 Tax=Aureisphaera galaxeae TaxID=1538023 RepID=UPI002350167F|nr:HD domain-containing protein [Aureisphaera galaxeae]MDC8002526.1 HD domain-containing protein [Aureisphaera galaxeae]
MPSKSNLIERTIAFVQKELATAEGGHDWFHIERVYKNTIAIAKTETVDEEVVLLGALLHDIADAKFHDGDETLGPKKARQFLEGEGVSREVINHVVAIIENVSFKGGNATKSFDSLELRVVQDADRLDALGAIGIARTFNYGGFKNRSLYDPSIPPKLDMTPEEYRASKAPTINHFYEKLLLLKDLMHTETGKKMAQQRHSYMEDFLSRFYAEWNGEA